MSTSELRARARTHASTFGADDVHSKRLANAVDLAGDDDELAAAMLRKFDREIPAEAKALAAVKRSVSADLADMAPVLCLEVAVEPRKQTSPNSGPFSSASLDPRWSYRLERDTRARIIVPQAALGHIDAVSTAAGWLGAHAHDFISSHPVNHARATLQADAVRKAK